MAEQRLIDANALIKDIDYSADMGGALGKVVECVKYYAKYMVASAPTIEERKKGKWEPFWAYGKTVRHRCSECLAVAARDDFGKEYLSDYCTVCGADMRGVTS